MKEQAHFALSPDEERIWGSIKLKKEPQRILLVGNISTNFCSLLCLQGHHTMLCATREDCLENSNGDLQQYGISTLPIYEYTPKLLSPFLGSSLQGFHRAGLTKQDQGSVLRTWEGRTEDLIALLKKLDFDIIYVHEPNSISLQEPTGQHPLYLLAEEHFSHSARTPSLKFRELWQWRIDTGLRHITSSHAKDGASPPLVSCILIFSSENETNWTHSLHSIRNQTKTGDFIEVIPIAHENKHCVDTLIAANKKSLAPILWKDTLESKSLPESLRQASKVASGAYVILLDASHDWLRRDAIEVLIKKAYNTGADLISCGYGEYKTYNDMSFTLIRNIESSEHSLFEDGHLISPYGFLILKDNFCSAIVDNNKSHFYFFLPILTKLVEISAKCISLPDILYLSRPVRYKDSEPHMPRLIADFFDTINLLRTTASPFVKDTAQQQHILVSFFASLRAMEPFITATEFGSITGIAPDQLEQYANSTVHIPISDKSRYKDLAALLEDSVVMLSTCIAYHVRNFVSIARELRQKGIKSHVLVMNNRYVSRRASDEEMASYADVLIETRYDAPEQLPLTPLCYVLIGDWADWWDKCIYYFDLWNMPYVGFFEGICDHKEMLSERRISHYTSFPFLLVPGEFAAENYPYQDTFICGLATIHRHLHEIPEFSATPLAIINLNFSYGVLTEARDLFLSTAIMGCERAGIRVLVNKHPDDRALLDEEQLSVETIDIDIQRASIVISRFSTVILEALASGKPVIYHNPHKEPVPNFLTSYGAYPITTSSDELAHAIRLILEEIEQGVDFRERAHLLLQKHAAIDLANRPEVNAASTIEALLPSFSAKKLPRMLALAKSYTPSESPKAPNAFNALKNQLPIITKPLRYLQNGKKDLVTVVSTANDAFLPYFSTMIQSIIDNASPDENYELLLLADHTTASEVAKITAQCKPYKNITFRVYGGLRDRLGYPPIKPTCYRLFLPDILPEHNKVLYIDCDTIALCDVANLFKTKIKDHYAATIVDMTAHSTVERFSRMGQQSQQTDYLFYDLGMSLEVASKYFNAGIVLLNLEKIRQDGIDTKIKNLFSTRNYKSYDQDILNLAFNGCIKQMPYKWNFRVSNDNYIAQLRDLPLSSKIWDKAAATPAILHYMHVRKPWKKLSADNIPFWQTARKTPFYETLLLNLTRSL